MSQDSQIERAAALIREAIEGFADIWNTERALDGRIYDLAEALLAAGWRPPANDIG